MTRVFLGKLALLVILVPLLHALGVYYTTTLAPEQISARYSFAEPTAQPRFWPTYRAALEQLAQGDLGTFQRVPVARFLAPWLRNTLALLGIALLLTVTVGPLLGLLAISPQTSRIRPAAQTVLTIGSTLPGFFLGSVLIVLILYLGRLGVYQGRGTVIPVQGFGLDAHLILPVLTLATRPILYVGYLAAGLIEGELQQEYVRVARSKGLRWRQIVWRHALPNVAGSIVIASGQSLRLLASGLILVEALFDWRGLGRLFLNIVALNESGSGTVYYLEPQLLAPLLTFFGALLLLTDLLATAIAQLADPRTRHPALTTRS